MSENTIENFTTFLENQGAVDVPEIQTEELVRITVDGDKGSEQSGSYKLFMNEGNGVPSGYINNYRTGAYEKWSGKAIDSAQRISPVDIQQRKAAKQQEKALFQAIKFQQFKKEWDSLKPADVWHPYMRAKNLKESLFKRVDIKMDDKHNLVFAIKDMNGTITNLQRIWSAGNKQMEKDGTLTGSFVKISGTADANRKSKFILVAEGVATAATVNNITGIETYAALTSNNLSYVASAIKKKHPDKTIVIPGDNDYLLTLDHKKNAGVVSAKEAAELVGGVAVFPPFKMVELQANQTDWNDFYKCRGFASTRDALRTAFKKIIDMRNDVETVKV